MILNYRLVQISCDKKTRSKFCWKETVVQLVDKEETVDAMVLLEKLGWSIASDYDLCPYCYQGIKEVNSHELASLTLVQHEKNKK